MVEARPVAGLRPETPARRGRIDRFEFTSELLARDNPLAEPITRTTHVYLPHDYDEGDRYYPLLCCLPAYTSSGPAALGWRNHGENLVQRLDRLIDTGVLDPVIVAFPDSYTALGGNQFVDSTALGAWASHLVLEWLPELDRRFRTVAESAGRGVFGKSSGGFGALHLATRFPGVFAAAISHAGDCGFDRVYARDFAPCCDELARFDGDIEVFVRDFWRRRRPDGRAFHTLMTLCLAASYSPSPGRPLNLELPFDLRTARLDEAVWARWLDFDPVRYDGERLHALNGLSALWIDAGRRDQYFIHYGTRELADRLARAGLEFHHAEFDGDHSGMDWRLDQSLPWAVARLKKD